MGKSALFVRHRAQPGRRNDLQAIWEKFIKPRVESNPNHEAYYFCHDDSDPDVVCVFQLYSSKQALDEFLAGSWYPDYLEEVSQVVALEPEIVPTSLVWNKER